MEKTACPDIIRDQKHTLRFRRDGQFRVLVFTDVQACPPAPQERTVTDMNAVIDREDPDLVLFCGDNAKACKSDRELHDYLAVLVGHLEEKKIPWAHVYGNHDDEGENTLTRAQQQDVYEAFPYCISKAGPAEVKGVGNYVLPVYPADESRSDPVFAVWGLDSGAYVDDEGLAGYQARLGHTMYRGQPESNYAYMPFSQILWYFDTSEEIERYAGHKVPGLAYFHIPLQEFYEVALNPEETGMTGEMREEVCAGPLNSGMFTAMIERGDIKAVCCGHDHCNDYAGTFCGICLAYAANIGYDTYHHDDMMGGRVFVIREETPDKIETYMSYVKQ
ncbi:MAG: metallophosphoesterase family protein [Clostridia bacterium]|nr:metallophosphoesterase family protein [Clostridia bacterium]MBQ8512615.1 metallophosphoesterase family protein [Clostridia bacterium]